MICIRADANEKIASGHIMRCLSIARSLQELGEDVLFVLADERGKYLVDNAGFSSHILKTEFDCLEKEIEIFTDFIIENQVSAVLLDSYYVTEAYMERLCSVTKLIYMDDLNRFVYPCHMLINYSPASVDMDYNGYDRTVKVLLGSRFVPLRKQFEALTAKEITETLQNLLILCGGTDPYNFSGLISERILQEKDMKITIVSGGMNSNKEFLYGLEKRNKGIKVYFDVQNMAEYMQEADIAITAGGSTIFELCACGTPMISYTFADNQIPASGKLAESGALLFIGDIRSGVDSCLGKCMEAMDKCKDRDFRSRMSARQQELVDGLGASRLAGEIKALLNE